MAKKITAREADRLHRALTRLSNAAWEAGVADATAGDDIPGVVERAEARHRVAMRLAVSAILAVSA